jgi:tRNA dimethylallyltransferase
VGYKELFDFIEGKAMPDGRQVLLDKAVEDIKKNTRHFAKRQITWFKKFNGFINFIQQGLELQRNREHKENT